ncbi:MAG: FAD-dependent oxidoreductase, partial [Thermoleophilaceae bacterium]
MSSRYDLVVLGGGAAGLVAAQTAAALGARVVLVERQKQPGGDCLFTGCVPSKSLIASAKLAHDMRTADRLGLDPREPEPDLARVMERVQRVIEQAGEPDTPAALAAKGVEVLRAAARFVGPGKVEVGERTLSYRAALIATGSVPTIPDLPGLAEADPLTNETVFALRELPERLAVLGGGPVGVELAQAFARLGARVEIVEASGTLLPKAEHEAGRFIGSVLEEEGVQVHTGSPAERFESGEGGGSGRLVTAEGNEIGYDRLFVALGRRAVTGDLGLETV